jgi:hypothetical protein
MHFRNDFTWSRRAIHASFTFLGSTALSTLFHDSKGDVLDGGATLSLIGLALGSLAVWGGISKKWFHHELNRKKARPSCHAFGCVG